MRPFLLAALLLAPPALAEDGGRALFEQRCASCHAVAADAAPANTSRSSRNSSRKARGGLLRSFSSLALRTSWRRCWRSAAGCSSSSSASVWPFLDSSSIISSQGIMPLSQYENLRK